MSQEKTPARPAQLDDDALDKAQGGHRGSVISPRAVETPEDETGPATTANG